MGAKGGRTARLARCLVSSRPFWYSRRNTEGSPWFLFSFLLLLLMTGEKLSSSWPGTVVRPPLLLKVAETALETDKKSCGNSPSRTARSCESRLRCLSARLGRRFPAARRSFRICSDFLLICGEKVSSRSSTSCMIRARCFRRTRCTSPCLPTLM